MIKITNLNKKYNKGKSNEIIVCNNINLELPDKGLVVFLGPSGSGKTTLLNIIGGLDKQDSGEINYQEFLSSKYNMKKVDKYRVENIGYIFQNYNLLNNQTVEENLKTALSLIGITDNDEVNKRIEYTLKAVKLYRFRKKLASALSGGQQQRVSIARALIKNSKIIIADEPTGNLDSENSVEIMNILKKISEKTLVLLVTHDKNLAYAYAQQIINIKDGQVISNELIVKNNELRNENSNKIYLKDLEKVENEGYVNTVLYKESQQQLNLTIVERNGVFYLQSDSPLKLLKDTDLKLIDAHYEHSTKIDLQAFNYDTSWYCNEEKYNAKFVKKTFINEIKTFFRTRKRTKFFHLVFALLGVIIGIINMMYITNTTINYDNINTEFQSYPFYQYQLSENELSTYVDALKEAIDNNLIYDIEENNYYEISYEENSIITKRINISFSIYNGILIKDCGILAGNKANSDEDIVIGKGLADKLLKEINLSTYEELLGINVNERYKIVGISSKNTSEAYKRESYKTAETLKKDIDNLISNSSPVLSIIVKDKDQFDDFFNSKDLELLNNYDYQMEMRKEDVKQNRFIYIPIIIVLTLIVIVYTYLTMRSKMISEIYTIGVYRALGTSKMKLILNYIISIFVISTFTTLMGYLAYIFIFGFIAIQLNNLGANMVNILVNPITYLMIIILYSISFLFGILPIYKLLKNTPAEILSKYDI